MTRRRNKARTKAKDSLKVEVDLEPVQIMINEKEDAAELSADSGTASPAVNASGHWKDKPATHHCSESIKAWKFYQACVLERYHWFLDRKRGNIASEFSDRISKACLHLNGENLLVKTQELQSSMAAKLRQVDVEEKQANTKFRKNIKCLEAGDDMTSLISIDPHITLDQVSEFIDKYINSTDEPVAIRKKDMSYSLSGSTSSEDSGVTLPESTAAGGLGLSSLSDIWKPEGAEFLNNSFSTGGLYTTRSEGSDFFPEASLFTSATTEILTAPPLPPNIADDDSAILRAVVSAPEPRANLVNDTLVSNLESAFLGLSGFTGVSAAYTSDAGISTAYTSDAAPLYEKAADIPQVPSSSANLLAFPNSLGQLEVSECAVDVQSEVSVGSANLSAFTSSYSQAGVNTSAEIDKRETCGSSLEDDERKKKKKKKKKSKATISSEGASEGASVVEPVKFTDHKVVGVKEQKLVDQLSFGWKEGNNEVIDANECVEKTVKVDDSGSAVLPQKPLSFAAVVLTNPKPTVHVQSSSEPKRSVGSVFSTKKTGRKFSASSSLNKTSPCWTFMKTKKCPWGADCIFAHGKKELQPLPKWFNKEEHSLKAPSKKDHSPHTEPCGNHYCIYRIQYLRRKTTICKLWQSGRCPFTKANCGYAHGQSDVKSLPKLEICRLHLKGSCSLKSTECVYAHFKAELQVSSKKNKTGKKAVVTQDCMSVLSCSPVSNRLRTISETSTASNDSWSFLYQQERVRTVSGTSFHSTDSQMMRDLEEFDWKAWDSQHEVPTNEEIDDDWNQDECVICAFDFSDEDPKFTLECEHDSFHIKCISQWILNKDKSCPICRHPTDLNDERFQQLQYVDEDEEFLNMSDE